ncbi:hypothetical protein B0T18DRAFT_410313 [Schizothecium vesticola]|uniref:Uncharacterized protein n=1 Tax=Schizothecium vesticola TaxID=314040 RepID=A0AA40EUN7_9PEZI|nr:hypothetical protein B0T18DRAFT_410313 [Schizothecium vesticola]
MNLDKLRFQEQNRRDKMSTTHHPKCNARLLPWPSAPTTNQSPLGMVFSAMPVSGPAWLRVI